jgi:hypothetical protein
MRLIYDSKKEQLFLSCHYSTPALIAASGLMNKNSRQAEATLQAYGLR